MQNEAINELVVYAERYAINRGSYANGSTADMVEKLTLLRILTPKTMTVLVRDIKTALHDKTIPYDDQEAQWQTTLLTLEKTLEAIKMGA